MRIVFLGTSHGVPEPDKRCSCIMLEVGENHYLIDAGTEPVPALVKRGISMDSLKGVFITHMHGDHTNGLLQLVDLCTWHYKTSAFKVMIPEIEAVDAIKGWIKALHLTPRTEIEYCEVKEGPVYDDGVIKVNAMTTGHMERAYAYIVESEGKRLLFSGDMKGPEEDFSRFLKTGHFDLAVGECAHFDAMMYESILKENPPSRFVINHFSSRRAESCYRLRRELGAEVNVTLASDNLEITL